MNTPVATIALFNAPELVDFLRVCTDLLPEEVEQYEAITGERFHATQAAANRYLRASPSWGIATPEEPLCVGGFDCVRPGVWRTWMLTRPMAFEPANWRIVTRYCRQAVDRVMESGANRVECEALASRTQALRWYEKGLRMQREAVSRKAGAAGQDFVTFVRVRE